ncbi:MAG: 4-hydroxyphenylpyruvate dioxygenase [Oscillatoriales cyanobacterium SM2_2_1]|nr:4-hydroxyphenylpyruvate dioxygenase [Oscillatoriales cyanobacterium SM2_2_1]
MGIGIVSVHFGVPDCRLWRRWWSEALGFQFLGIVNGREVLRHGGIEVHLSVDGRSPGVRGLGLMGAGAPLVDPCGLHWEFVENQDPLPVPGELFTVIDHVVLNVPAGQLEVIARWYQEYLGLGLGQQFDIRTEHSGLRSVVLHDRARGIQVPINEPSSGQSQVQEFLDHYGGPGVQHLALRTEDIYGTVAALGDRGVAFLATEPPILVEKQPERAALLQIFTQPLFGKPTFFLEIIQRQRQAQGFGDGNFQRLFEAIEREQQRRKGSLRC